MEKIKGIIFDWGDTLSPTSLLEKYFPVSRVEKKFKLEKNIIKKCLEAFEKYEPAHYPRTIEKEKKILIKLWSNVTKNLSIKNPDLFINYLLEWAFEKYIPPLFSDVLKTIQALYREKYRLAVLSNGWPSRFLEIKRSKIGKYFKTILVSSLIGTKKPDIKSYKITLKRLKLPVNQVIMVDNKEHFLLPAYKLGMQVIFLDRINFNPSSQLPRARNLVEVQKLVTKLSTLSC